MTRFTAVKIFSSTMWRDRDAMGERITEWLRAHPEFEIVESVVTQSSDTQYHCVTITLFLAGDSTRFLQEEAASRGAGPTSSSPRSRATSTNA